MEVVKHPPEWAIFEERSVADELSDCPDGAPCTSWEARDQARIVAQVAPKDGFQRGFDRGGSDSDLFVGERIVGAGDSYSGNHEQQHEAHPGLCHGLFSCILGTPR